MTEYNTDVHTLTLAADYQATEKLELEASINYSDAQVDWTGLNLSTPAAINDPTLLGTIYDIPAVNVIADYSDLQYVQTEIGLGGTYQFSPMLYTTAQLGWQLFEDKDPYVYGDQDGTAYRGSVGLGYRF